jgi:hypothetical protein
VITVRRRCLGECHQQAEQGLDRMRCQRVVIVEKHENRVCRQLRAGVPRRRCPSMRDVDDAHPGKSLADERCCLGEAAIVDDKRFIWLPCL